MFVLLRWWFIISLSGFGAFMGHAFGLFKYIKQVDATYLSFVTIAIFAVMTVFVGYQTWSAKQGDQTFKKHLPLCWFVADALMGIGMLGTLIGFMMLLSIAFSGQLNLQDAAATQKILQSMATGFATACMTTIVGLVTSLVFKLQLLNLEYFNHED